MTSAEYPSLMPPRTPPAKSSRDSGQTLVEFVIVLPLLLAVLTAIISFGKVYMDYTKLGDVSRVGARKAVVSRTAPDPTGAAIAAARATAAGLDASKLNVTVSSTWTAGETVTVTATYPWSVDVVGMTLQSGTLTQTTTMRVE
jgi:Flp pilus assembly protein TadG